MAFGDWDKVAETYERVLEHRRYGELAQRMLALVGKIRSRSVFEATKPGTSLLTLFFVLPDVQITINVIWHEGDDYRVYLYHPDLEVIDDELVKEDKVIYAIERHIDKLSREVSDCS